MKNILLYFVFISAIVALFAFAYSFSQQDEPTGKKIFMDYSCGKCHSIESLEFASTGKKPVDLSNVGGNLTAEVIVKYLKKEEKLNDKNHPFSFKGTDEELNQLVEWLVQLRTVE